MQRFPKANTQEPRMIFSHAAIKNAPCNETAAWNSNAFVRAKLLGLEAIIGQINSSLLIIRDVCASGSCRTFVWPCEWHPE